MARCQFKKPLEGPVLIRQNRHRQIRDIFDILNIGSNGDNLPRFRKYIEISRPSAAPMMYTDTKRLGRAEGHLPPDPTVHN